MARGRYEGALWRVPVTAMDEAMGKAREAGKTPLLLDPTEQKVRCKGEVCPDAWCSRPMRGGSLCLREGSLLSVRWTPLFARMPPPFVRMTLPGRTASQGDGQVLSVRARHRRRGQED
eukprot:4898021-Prymnesium_polylepis.1